MTPNGKDAMFGSKGNTIDNGLSVDAKARIVGGPSYVNGDRFEDMKASLSTGVGAKRRGSSP